ncbi:hypothetical protein IVB25_16605 [Bradyrhizobium sp. 193]|nr:MULTISPECIES: DUF6538 domain-containing protein [unclassified Bradyrhizobium]MCK1345038.1 hypothetical protein [Bradyrhizobium sp. CW11]MCK1484288.1 hypothetical protein [Bradyrhizobium sp. 193]MCK1707506.1 hypothetical protein [Bradyrhizobium sp. 146]
MHDGFGDLINAKTGRFKRELVRSLQTKDLKEAKKRDHRAALQATKLFDEAIKALSPRDASNESPVLDLGELESEVFVELLGVDEAERLEGDDRRHLQTQEDRAKWPDLEPIPSNAQLGMSADHFHIYGELLPVFEKEFREAFARRDPKIVYPETNIALKRRGIYWSKASAEFQGAALVVLKAHVRACVSAWNKDPVFGVIGIQSFWMPIRGPSRTPIDTGRMKRRASASAERSYRRQRSLSRGRKSARSFRMRWHRGPAVD